MLTEQLGALRRLWAELEGAARSKAGRLLDASRAELCGRSCAELRGWLGAVGEQLRSEEYGKDLSGVNRLLQKQQVGGGRRRAGKGGGCEGSGGGRGGMGGGV